MNKVDKIKLLGEYVNGNYKVTIYSNGTRVKETLDPDATEFISDKPCSMDVKITDRYDGVNGKLCPQCHENSSKRGKQGDILNLPFIDDLLPYSEISIGGGNPLIHSDLDKFLIQLKERNIIPSITVNQYHFEKDLLRIKKLADDKLIYGISVSLVDPTEGFVNKIKMFPNAVIHVINGIVTLNQLEKLYDHDLKILILGYKQVRKGITNYDKNKSSIDYNQMLLKKALTDGLLNKFQVISFDNLAIAQLKIKEWLPKEQYDSFYQGDDGQHTMYVDCINREYAVSSTHIETRKSFDEISLLDYFKNIKK